MAQPKSDLTFILGGAFDPPHRGHLQLIHEAIQLGPRRILVIPAGAPPLKTSTVSFRQRLEMARLCFDGMDGVILDPREETRFPSFTFDTLEEVAQEYGKIAFLMGSDQLQNFPKWSRFPEILKKSHWIIFERAGEDHRQIQSILRELASSGLIESADSSGCFWRVRNAQTWIEILPTRAPLLSSTRIREEIARTGRPPEDSLSQKLTNYLKLHGLYGISKSDKKDKL